MIHYDICAVILSFMLTVLLNVYVAPWLAPSKDPQLVFLSNKESNLYRFLIFIFYSCEALSVFLGLLTYLAGGFLVESVCLGSLAICILIGIKLYLKAAIDFVRIG